MDQHEAVIRDLFGVLEEPQVPVPTVKQRSPRRKLGVAPKQKQWKMPQGRLIAFRPRKGRWDTEGEDQAWTPLQIIKILKYQFKLWEESFPYSTCAIQLYDFWSWMLGNPHEPFSFHNALVANGFRNASAFIESLESHCPKWVADLLVLSDDDAAVRLNQMVKAQGRVVASPRAA